MRICDSASHKKASGWFERCKRESDRNSLPLSASMMVVVLSRVPERVSFKHVKTDTRQLPTSFVFTPVTVYERSKMWRRVGTSRLFTPRARILSVLLPSGDPHWNEKGIYGSRHAGGEERGRGRVREGESSKRKKGANRKDLWWKGEKGSVTITAFSIIKFNARKCQMYNLRKGKLLVRKDQLSAIAALCIQRFNDCDSHSAKVSV